MSLHNSLPDLVTDADGEPVFDAPWQAQAFAMALALHERGVFTWSEWVELLGSEIATGDHGEGNDGYYFAWLSALEAMVEMKGLACAREISARHTAWAKAAENTPHGTPIELKS